MKKSLYFLLVPLFLGQVACDKTNLVAPNNKTLEVIFLDFDNSCNENLQLTGGKKIYDFHRGYQSSFLHSDIDQWPVFSSLSFGDTLKVEFRVLEENPYSQRFILCNRESGIPVTILDTK